ncbi:MAG: hypothetical protein DMG77_05055 [Acidobacteria bacterium]|nr:MAG: hypothetical protein DMG77_05055 [Acidobacteriota bacterium]
MTPDALTRTVQDFLSEAAGAVVLEDGAVAFDLGRAKYSISGEYNKCLLHLWSAEAKYRAGRARRGGEKWDAATGGTTAGPVASHEARNLPGTGSALSIGQESVPGGL